jgi:hypothetical protein
MLAHDIPAPDRREADGPPLPHAGDVVATRDAGFSSQPADRKPRQQSPLPKELGGRDSPEPVRNGDWEKKGLAVDF